MARRKAVSKPIEPHEKYNHIEVLLLNRSRHLEGKRGHYNGRLITSRVIDLD